MREAMFKKADANADGAVDKAELTTMIKNAPKPSEANGAEGPDVDKLFTSLDANGDSKITASEMDTGMAKMMSMKPGGAGGPPPGGPPPGGGGGKGAASEASSTSNKIYDPKDDDNDGTVSYAEEVKYALKHPEADQKQSSSQIGSVARTDLATGRVFNVTV
jgi:hypothetical protein